MGFNLNAESEIKKYKLWYEYSLIAKSISSLIDKAESNISCIILYGLNIRSKSGKHSLKL